MVFQSVKLYGHVFHAEQRVCYAAAVQEYVTNYHGDQHGAGQFLHDLPELYAQAEACSRMDPQSQVLGR